MWVIYMKLCGLARYFITFSALLFKNVVLFNYLKQTNFLCIIAHCSIRQL